MGACVGVAMDARVVGPVGKRVGELVGPGMDEEDAVDGASPRLTQCHHATVQNNS